MLTLARLSAITLVAAVVAPAPFVAASQPTDDLDARLDAMIQRLDDRREQLHVPGLAIAVVLDGEVILARGLGVADVETQRPVTPETIFAIGSSTKSFTSALVGIGVDRGELHWDEPAFDALPGFRLPPAEGSESVSIRDLLCHRTGLTRMPLLWASGTGTIDDMLAAVPRAEYYQPFREGWLYNNVTYSMGGYAAAHQAGEPWEDLLQHRILDPLGMDDTDTARTALTDNPAAALGYSWNDESGTFEHLPPRDLRLIAPAGAINSSVNDMTKWVTMLLNEGSSAEGERIISPRNLHECWQQQVAMPDGRGYGLGWMIGSYDGTKYYEHGGNIDGFASALVVMPEHGIGLTALMNVTASPLQGEVITMVFDAVLGSSDAPAADAEPEQGLDRYAGSYAFDALGGDMVIEVDGETLLCHIPSQGSTPLSAPDSQGKRKLVVNPTIQVRFKENDAGDVIAMEFFQAGSHIELPRRAADGSIITPEVPFDEAQLRGFTGSYHFPPLNDNCTVLYEDGLLSMDVPSQMTYALAWDAGNDRWRFRDHADITLVFNRDGDAPAASITFSQGGNTHEMPRVGEPSADVALPTLAELTELREKHTGMSRLTPGMTMRARGTVSVSHQGVRGEISVLARGPYFYASASDLSPFVTSRSVVTPEVAWTRSAMTPEPETELPGTKLYEVATYGHPWTPTMPFDQYSADVRVSGIEPFGDTPDAIVVVITPEHAPEVRHYVDPKSGRTLAIRASIPAEAFGDVPFTTTYSDWDQTDGVWFPRRWQSDNPFTGESVVQITGIELGVELPEDAFAIEEPATERTPAAVGGG